MSQSLNTLYLKVETDTVDLPICCCPPKQTDFAKRRFAAKRPTRTVEEGKGCGVNKCTFYGRASLTKLLLNGMPNIFNVKLILHHSEHTIHPNCGCWFPIKITKSYEVCGLNVTKSEKVQVQFPKSQKSH